MLVAFMGIKSGAGASTLACLAAICLAERNGAALIDLNPESKVRTYMGFPADVSSASILDINGVNSPESVICAGEDSSVCNLKVFPGAIRALDASQVSAALQHKACSSLKQAFSSTVAVMGPLYSSSWAGLILADTICVVINPSRTDMDSFRDQMDTLRRLGVASRVRTILNKLGYPGSLDKKGAMGFFQPDMAVAYDKSIAGACNRRSLLPTRELKNKFNRMLCQDEEKGRQGMEWPGFLRRL